MERPRPAITPESAPFWAACAEGRLLFQRCTACARVQPYARAACVACGAPGLEWLDSRREGVIVTFTTVHRAPGPAFKSDVPYVIALVDLDEGFRMMLNLRGSPETVHIGQRVTVVPEQQEGRWWLPQAIPAG